MNELLTQADATIAGLVKDRERFDRFVAAGKKVIYDEKLFAELSQALAKSEDPVADIARGIVGVVNLLAGKARGSLPGDVAMQGGMALLIDALDFAVEAGLIEVDEETLARATREFIELMMPALGETPQKLGSALSAVGNTINTRMGELTAQGGA